MGIGQLSSGLDDGCQVVLVHDSREGRVPKNNESALNKIVSMKYERGKTFLS